MHTVRIACVLFVAAALSICSSAGAAPTAVGFDSGRWELADAQVVDHLGRRSLVGTAVVKDVEFLDGVIEVDVAVDGRRSYPGFVFRHQSEGMYERVYLRPHRAGLYPDAIQYAPVFNGVAGWQLYHGEGFTAGAEIPLGEWTRLKIEIRGSQARVFLNDAPKPALVIHDLKHGVSKGAIGLMGPENRTAYFSNFRYESTDKLSFSTAPKAVTAKGTIMEWSISKPIPASQIDRTKYPTFFQVYYAEWKTVQAEANGLVNLSRYVKAGSAEPHTVLARTRVHASKPREVRLSLGYSDDVTVFLNGKPVFSGQSGYRSRDPSYVGVVGLFDTVFLPLRKGLNEIFLMVTDSFGGWGFMARTHLALKPPDKQYELLTKVWETPADFKIPESVLYDAERDVLYVSSFDRVEASHAGRGFISRVKTDGQIEELKWVTGLDGPCGMGIHGDTLYVVEGFRGNLVAIDIPTGKVTGRHSMPGAQFVNDLVIDDSGTVFASNTSRSLSASDIFAFQDGKAEVWKTGDDLHRTNGLFLHDGDIFAGSTGDGLLKRVDLATGHTRVVTSFGAGVIDGIRVDNDGNYLVSHWEGQVYRVSPSGKVVEILDLTPTGWNCADFEFIKNENLLIIPTFMGNRVVAYRLGKS